MTESGQHGKYKQQGVHDKNRLDHSGPSEDIGSPSGEVRVIAGSGWERFRKPADREIRSALILSASSRNGSAVLAASSDNNGPPSFDVQVEEPVLPPADLSDQGGPPSGGKRPKGRKRHWRYTVPAVVILSLIH